MRIKLLPPILLLAACSSPPPIATPPSSATYQPPVVMVAPHNVVDEMLSYNQQLLRMARADLPREFDRLLERPKSLSVALQKAMVLGQMGRKNDLARAQANLMEVIQHPSTEAQQLKSLAQLLSTHYAVAQRLIEQLEHSERSLADSQHRIQQLSQTLEQLKAVERSLPSRMGVAASPSEVQQDKK